MRSLDPLAFLAACTFNRIDPTDIIDAAPPIDADEREWVVIETLSVPSKGMLITSTKVLRTGVPYRLRASGTFYYDTQVFADAEYFDVDVGRTPMDSLSGVDGGLAVNDATVGPVRDFKWGAFSAGHVYEAEWIGDGAPITAQIHDGNYGGNAGSLTLEILALQ